LRNDVNRESLLKRSLHTIRVLKEKLDRKTDIRKEPIAVIGMACRFPGGCTTPEAFWSFLKNKGDGVIDVPADRWDMDKYYDPKPGTSGKMYIRQAGFLQEDIGAFDARFFRVSPAEAREIDPQHRLLLEVSWEALERAGQNPDRLKGSNTGVFVGILGSEYSILMRDPDQMNPYTGVGTVSCIASGRISYILGLHGPSISLNTACSSSLISVRYACESLRNRESDMALAGGVNLMLSPDAIVSLCLMGALAKDGRCKPFDANGDGYGRAEGCGMIVLKRLSDAEKDRDRILALICAEAVNHDGPSSGLTVPSKAAQRDLILSALKQAEILPEDVSYLEAHGTGTSLGDPIEIEAVTEVFGNGTRRQNPLLIGSVKGNIGHLETAAGIAGLIKVILCLNHKEIPPNIHLETMNPRLRFEKIPATVPREMTPWNPEKGKERIAGISSFGFSGTNAHIVLREAPEKRISDPKPDRPCFILTLSAKTDTALKRLIQKYYDHLKEHPEQSIGDICYTAAAGRAHFSHRAAFMARDNASVQAQLKQAITGPPDDRYTFFGKAEDSTRSKTAFLFGEDIFEKIKNEALRRADDSLNLDPFSLILLLESWGIRPSAVYGEGAGAYTAACAAGVMSPDFAADYVSETVAVLKKTGQKELPEEFVRRIAGKKYQTPRCRLISALSGKPVKKNEVILPEFWQKEAFSPAASETAMASLYEQGCRIFIDFGPGSGILGKARRYLPASDSSILFLPVVGAGSPLESLFRILGHLYCSGADIRWETVDQDYMRQKVLVPTYPFERKRYWIPLLADAKHADFNKVDLQSGIETDAKKADFNKIGLHSGDDPLEGKRFSSPFSKSGFEYQYVMSRNRIPELNDSHGILHVGYYQELLCRTVRESFDTGDYVVEETEFLTALVISESGEKAVHLFLEPDEKGKVKFEFYSKGDKDRQWNLHVRGNLRLNKRTSFLEMSSDSFLQIRRRCSESLSGQAFYQLLQSKGIHLGASVQWADEVRYREGEVFARLKMPASIKDSPNYSLGIHPGVLDACAQVFHAGLSRDIPADMRFMVIKWSDAAFNAGPRQGNFWCHVLFHENPAPDGTLGGEIHLFDNEGRLVARVGENRMKGLSSQRVAALNAAVAAAASSASKGAESALLGKLRRASREQKKTMLTAYFRELMAEYLDMPISELDATEALSHLGMDSLVGLRFKNKVAEELGADLSMEILIQGPSISELAEKTVQTAFSGEAESSVHTDEEDEKGINDREIWFSYRKVKPESRLRLFCFPYGGRGASLYRKWQEKLPDFIEVCPIQLPGRENRFKEIPPSDIEEMTDHLTEALMPDLDRPFALYGHSAGGLIAFRLAFRLWKNSGKRAEHLFIGGYTAPHLPNPFLNRKIAELTAAGFPGIPHPDQVTEDALDRVFDALVDRGFEGMFERTVPVMKRSVAALKMVESFYTRTKTEDERLDIPLTVFHGRSDTFVNEAESEAWKEATTGPFDWHIAEGNHFFLHEDQSEAILLAKIRWHLRNKKEGE